MTGQIIRETPRQATINGLYKTTLTHRQNNLSYELFTTDRAEPAVKSLKSGKTFFLTGSDVVDLAIAAGVDNDDVVPKKRKWPPLPVRKPLYESKPIPEQSTAHLASNLVDNVSVDEIPEKLGNCTNYSYHLNRRVDQDVANYLKKYLARGTDSDGLVDLKKCASGEMRNIVVVDMLRDAKFLAEQLKCPYITGVTPKAERESLTQMFKAGALNMIVTTEAMLTTDRVVDVVLRWVSLKMVSPNIRGLVRSRQCQLVLYHRHDTIFDRTSIKRNLALFQKQKEPK